MVITVDMHIVQTAVQLWLKYLPVPVTISPINIGVMSELGYGIAWLKLGVAFKF